MPAEAIVSGGDALAHHVDRQLRQRVLGPVGVSGIAGYAGDRELPVGSSYQGASSS